MAIKKRNLWFLIIAVLIVLALIIHYHGFLENNLNSSFNVNSQESKIYSFSQNTISYSKDREIPEYEISFVSNVNGVNKYALNFTSRPFLNYTTLIYGLLFMPENKTNLPGIVFLPAGGMSKNQREKELQLIAQNGYAIIAIDQRGINQTGGIYLGLEQDFEVFLKGHEPIQHLSVYDGLKTFDVLKQIKEVNSSNIAIMGESMGARYAIIAAALDPNIKGALIISGAGFHVMENLSSMPTNYLVSIDPDHYVSKISPRPIMFLQGDNDSVVKLKDAQYTYNIAKQPKKFFIAKGCSHGYCKKMQNELFDDLKIILGE